MTAALSGADAETIERMARAICPFLRQMEPCLNCPAEVETPYGRGTQMCRLHACEAAQAAFEARHGPIPAFLKKPEA